MKAEALSALPSLTAKHSLFSLDINEFINVFLNGDTYAELIFFPSYIHLILLFPIVCDRLQLFKLLKTLYCFAYDSQDMPVWVIVGASRGIGLEWVRQLLARGDHILASVRDAANASQLWSIAGAAGGKCQLFECDVSSETSIVVRATPSSQVLWHK